MSATPLFRDRHAAGEVVAQCLASYRETPNVTVLGMARGGVVVAAPVAVALGAALEVMVARKLGVPGIEEVAFGAIAEGLRGAALDAVHGFIGIPRGVMATVIRKERRELARRVHRYRGSFPLPDLAGRTVIIVDDGLSTGATLKAAGLALRANRPARLVAAVPVATQSGVVELRRVFDDVVAVATPEPFETVSAWYEDFAPVDDAAVLALLGEPVAGADAVGETADERPVSIPVAAGLEPAVLAGDLGMPSPDFEVPRGLVIFAHGGGSSRRSYRNRYLAGRLRLAGWATLRVDLLLEPEQRTDAAEGAVRFDIALITRRLHQATEWAIRQSVPGAERIVLFGASTGAAAAAGVAVALPASVAGLIGRGGRIDLAEVDPVRVRTPALLIVGERDLDTLERTRDIAGRLAGSVSLKVVPGAGHTFEEPGTLGAVGELVVNWLTRLHYRGVVRRWLGAHRHRLPAGSGARSTDRSAQAVAME